MRHFLTALSVLLLAMPAFAQPYFIPDLTLRERLNEVLEGAVGADGYLIATDIVLDTWTDTIDWSPCDLTGLGYLGVENLFLHFAPGVQITAFPAFPTHAEVVHITSYPGTELPDIAGPLMYVSIKDPVGLTSMGSIIGTGPEPIYELKLRGFPADCAWPVSVQNVFELSIDTCYQALPPSLGPGVRNAFLMGLPNMTVLPHLEGATTFMYAGAMPALTSLWATPPTGLLQELHIAQADALPSTAGLPEDLIYLRLDDCPSISISTLDLPSALEALVLHDMPGASLPPLPAGLVSLDLFMSDVTELPAFPASLAWLEVTNTQIQELPALPEGMTYLWLTYNPQLACLPALPATLTDLYTDLPCYPNQPPIIGPLPLCTILNSTCPEYSPMVSGHVFHDIDHDGEQGELEPDAVNMIVHFAPSGHMAGTNAQGNYQIGLPVGEHTFHVTGFAAPYEGHAPAEGIVVFNTMADVVTGADFALQASGPIPLDRRIGSVFDTSPPRPGFTRNLVFDTYCTYNYPSVVTVEIDPMEEFISANITPTTVVGNTLTFDLEQGQASLELELRTPVSVPLSTVLIDLITVTPMDEDPTPEDNVVSFETTVVGSYDPNDKQVFPASLTPTEVAADATVEYLIRFQNTGTYLAERVLITDTLSTDLQWDTFQFLQSSHPCEWFMRDGVVHFVFNDIMLPDSTADEPGSHGFVRFTIHPGMDLVQGESVTNVANIYFDFNEPVITEPCVLPIELITAVEETRIAALKVYPVPAHDLLSIELPASGAFAYEVVAADGQVVMRGMHARSSATLNIADLRSGVYALRTISERGEWSARFVKD